MKNKWIALLLCLSLLLSMTACQSRENPAPTPDQPTASDQQTQDEQPQPDEGEEEVEQPQEEEKTATLYIGMDGEFESYPVDYTGKLTPDWLIEQISELTGWNLDLAEPTTDGGWQAVGQRDLRTGKYRTIKKSGAEVVIYSFGSV